jgi:uncharacterized cupredoxin-like copper-binding protein
VIVLAGCSSAAGGTAPPSTAPSVAVSPPASATPSIAVTPTPAPSATLGFTPGTKATPRLIHIDTSDSLLFAPNILAVARDETVTFEITNPGKVEHEFMVGPQTATFADEAPTEVAGIEGGQTKSITYTFKGPGPFAFACHAKGHYESGMFGFIQLVGPGVASVGTTKVPRIAPIRMSDALKFDPATEPVAPGETVSFVLVNSGTVSHEFQVGPEAGVAADTVDGKTVVEIPEIAGGHVAELTYTFPATGTFAFACHVSGHYEAGMRGTVTLQ